MKETSLKKISGLVLAIAVVGLGVAGVKQYSRISKNEVAQALSANNGIKNEQVVENSPFEDTISIASSVNKEPLLSSKIMDKFEEATEAPDESDIKEKGIETLVEESKQEIKDYIIENSSKLENEADKNFASNYGTEVNIDKMVENVDDLTAFYSYDWEDDTFETEIKDLIDNYNILTGVEMNVSDDKTANGIGNNAGDDMEGTSGDVTISPSTEEKVEEEKKFLGISEDVWKVYGIYGLEILAAAGAIGLGIGEIVKRSRKKKSNTNDLKYFVGKDYVKKIGDLSSISAKVEEIENEIARANKKAILTKSSKSKIRFSKLAKDLEKSKDYVQLKNKKTLLSAEIGKIVGESVSTDVGGLEFLKGYASASKHFVKVPENHYKELGRVLSKAVKKCIRLEKSIEKKSKNKIKLGLNFEQKQLKKQEKKIISRLNSASLTGPQKVSLNRFLNNSSTLLEKENLVDLKNFAYSLKKSNKKVYKESMKLLKKEIKVETSNLNGDYKKSSKQAKSATKLQNKIKKFRPDMKMNYYGYKNQIKDIPINPNRFVCSEKSVDTKNINTFFDAVSNFHMLKDQKINELTLSYSDENGKEKSMVCSYDNKDAINLMKAKFLTSIPKCSKVKIVERIIVPNKSEDFVKTEYDLENDPKNFEKAVYKSNLLVSGFNSLLENRDSTIKTLSNNINMPLAPKGNVKPKTADEISRMFSEDGRDF